MKSHKSQKVLKYVLAVLLVLFLAFIIGILISYFFSGRKKDKKKESYDSGEHVISANGNEKLNYKSIVLDFPDGKIDASNKKLNLPNGLTLTFGQILALAGDIYGDPDKPISSGNTPSDRMKNFLNFFNTLGDSGVSVKVDGKKVVVNAPEEIPKVLQVFQQELDMIDNYLSQGKNPSEGFAKSGYTFDTGFNKATGGGDGTISRMLGDKIQVTQLTPPGRYLELAKQNFDHFADEDCAWKAYMAGHTLAMTTAALAKNTNNIKTLELAYAYDAFACHFLSDLFSSGHLRTPRKALHTGQGTFGSNVIWESVLGDYCSKLMHDEDNKKGLNVSNNACRMGTPECSSWKCYGDSILSDSVNQDNLKAQHKALQRSVDEVWQSYVNGRSVDSNVFPLIPDTSIINKNNSIPMFRYDGKTLWRRTKDGKGEETLFSALNAIYDFKEKLFGASADSDGKITIDPFFK